MVPPRKPQILFTVFMLAFLLASLALPQAVTLASPVLSPQSDTILTPVVTMDVRHDTSIPLRQMQALPPPDQPAAEVQRMDRPGLEGFPANDSTDPDLIQQNRGLDSMPVTTVNFDGIPGINNVHPPDTNGDVGPNHYMQWVNLSLQVWDKEGNSLFGPVNGNTIWQGFGGICETTNSGDPIVLYDELADRWFISQFGLGSTYYQCIAVSATPDPTGAWHRYAFLYSNGSVMNDYPKFGVWPDAYYMSANQFYGDYGVGVVAYEREKMLQGLTARQVYINLRPVNSNFWALLPSDYDGTPPPAGTPNYYLSWDDSSSGISPNDAIHIWEFDVDWNNPANSTFGINGQPNLTINTASLDPNMCNWDRDCIPQQGVSQGLDAISGQAMYRAQYRNFGTHETLVGNVTVDAGGDHAAVYWFELHNSGSGFQMYQQGVFAPDDDHRWMGSAALDGMGNLALVYSVSNSDMHPAIRYAGRLVTDPLNQLTQGEATLYQGPASSISTYYRWGDYSMIGVDPTDTCTFWLTSEYMLTQGVRTWATRIGAFQFGNCQGPNAGTLQGYVIDQGTQLPIEGAVVSVGSVSTLTAADGSYSMLLPAGTYDATAEAYGYDPITETVEITSQNVTEKNFSLTALPLMLVSGTVTDGSGHEGMPLYALIDIGGAPLDPIYSNPLTGEYQVMLVQGYTYAFSVSAVAAGYLPVSRDVTVPETPAPEDFELLWNPVECTAPGYSWTTDGLYEAFESGAIPTGWSIVDNRDNGQVWQFDNPASRLNYTGGAGGFAIVDSNFYGAGGTQNTELITPALDLSDQTTIQLQFDTDFNQRSVEIAHVDVSSDGGTTWTNVWAKTSDFRTQHVSLDITPHTGDKTNVRVRFHYYNGVNGYWWQVDNVQIGQDPTCEAISGGLVAGQTLDANTGMELNDSPVSSSLQTVHSFATPLDENIGDGFFIVFAPAGESTLSATHAGGYGTVADFVSVEEDLVTAHDLNIPAGMISPVPGSIEVTLGEGMLKLLEIHLQNTGGVDAEFTLTEMAGLPFNPEPTGPYANRGRLVGPKRMSETSAAYVPAHDYPTAPDWENAGEILSSYQTGLPGAWGLAVLPDGTHWVGSIEPTGGDGFNHRYLNGVPTDDLMAALWGDDWAADIAYNPFTGNLWQVSLADINCIQELNPGTRLPTGRQICPSFGVSQRGLTFDPVSKTFYSGSWNDGIIYHFDSNGIMLDSINTSFDIAGLAYHPNTHHLFVLQSGLADHDDVYVLDPAAGYAILGSFKVEGLGDFAQAGMDMTCDGSLWLVDQNTGEVKQVSSGEASTCSFADVPWLTVEPLNGTIPAGGEHTISLTLNALQLLEGTYQAYIEIGSDTPYPVNPVTVQLTVVPGLRIFTPLILR